MTNDDICIANKNAKNQEYFTDSIARLALVIKANNPNKVSHDANPNF